MAQRVVVLVDAHNVGIAAKQYNLELDYDLLLRHIGKGNHSDRRIAREIVIARVYLGPTPNPDSARLRFQKYVTGLGYEVRVCREEGNGLKSAVDLEIMHDILVYAYSGRADVIVLVGGDGGFISGLRTAKALGVQVEVWGFRKNTALVLQQEMTFHALEDSVVVRPRGRD